METKYYTLIFLFASVVNLLYIKYSTVGSDFKNSLTNDQLINYDNIRKERMKIFFKGLVIGIISAIGYMYFYIDKDIYNLEYKDYLILFAICIFIITIYYLLQNKQKLVDYLKTPDQFKKYITLSNYYGLSSCILYGIIIINFLPLLDK